MIRSYFLPVITTNTTEQVAGQEWIHHAVLLVVEEPDTRLLLMDATPEEHTNLSNLAILVRDPTQDELNLYHLNVTIIPPDPDYDRACELLTSSPDVITAPQMWELLRIFGKRLGYHFD